MKILFLESVLDHGGARKSTMELAIRLRDKGMETLFVDFYGTCNEFFEDLESNELNYIVLKKSDKPFILFNKNIIQQIINYIVFFLESLVLRKRLNKILSKFQPDYVFVNGTKTLSILQKSPQFKTVFFARGWYIASQISKKDRLLLRKKVDLFFAVSQSTRQALFSSKIAKLDNIYVVKNGIDIKFIEEKIKDKTISISEKLILMHSGGFLPSKGHHISIMISKKLNEMGVDHHLYLTGKIYKEPESSEYYNKITDLINEFNLEDNIEVVTNKNDVSQYFLNSDIFIHPSESEGLPRVLMEAIAYKCVVIANPVGGVTDYVLDGFTGYIAHYNDVDSFVTKIIYVKNNLKERMEIIDRSYELVRRCYTEDEQVKEITRILNDNLIR